MPNYLHLNSQYANNTNAVTPQWNLSKPIRVNRLELLAANVPHSYHTVSESMSTSAGFKVQRSGSPADTIVLTPRTYTLTTLAAEIQTKVRALDGAYSAFTCVADLTTLKLTMSFGSLWNAQISDPRYASLLRLVEGINNPSFNVLNSENACSLATSCLYLTSKEIGTRFGPSPIGNGRQPATTFLISNNVDAGSEINWSSREYDQKSSRTRILLSCSKYLWKRETCMGMCLTRTACTGILRSDTSEMQGCREKRNIHVV